jgi:GT2 family glycosyltransferase
MNISVVICTRNRPKELVECIKTICSQSLLPTELIIVDASDNEQTRLSIRDFSRDFRLKYVRSKRPSYLSTDRNVGIRNSSGDVILFLDDDTLLDRDFIKEIVRVFEEDKEKRVGGAMGNIVNAGIPAATTLGKLYANLHLVISYVFLLPIARDGRYRVSGSPTYVANASETRDVEFLSGCCMAYRAEIFQDLKFEEKFPELYEEDGDLSYRVSKRYRNVYTPYAKLVHRESDVGSARYRVSRPYERAKKTVESNYYHLKKNFPRTVKNTVAFWWSVIGMLAQGVVMRNIQYFKGVINGVSGTKEIVTRLASCNSR